MKWEYWATPDNSEGSLFPAGKDTLFNTMSNDEVPVPLIRIIIFEAGEDLDEAKAELDRLIPTRHYRSGWKNFKESSMDKAELDAIVNECDPGIRRLVRLLNENGFYTCDSGDGVTKVASMECALPYPNVAIQLDDDEVSMESEADRLLELLTKNGVKFRPLESVEDTAPVISANYDPVLKSSIIELTYVTDEMLS